MSAPAIAVHSRNAHISIASRCCSLVASRPRRRWSTPYLRDPTLLQRDTHFSLASIAASLPSQSASFQGEQTSRRSSPSRRAQTRASRLTPWVPLAPGLLFTLTPRPRVCTAALVCIVSDMGPGPNGTINEIKKKKMLRKGECGGGSSCSSVVSTCSCPCPCPCSGSGSGSGGERTRLDV